MSNFKFPGKNDFAEKIAKKNFLQLLPIIILKSILTALVLAKS